LKDALWIAWWIFVSQGYLMDFCVFQKCFVDYMLD
jgi:hypothetical protein